MTTKTKQVTQRQAEATLAKVKKMFAAYGPEFDGLYLNMEWDWPSGGPTPSIIWEGGPYDWAMLFPGGGISEEFGANYPGVKLPAGVWVEAYSGWAICLYRED